MSVRYPSQKIWSATRYVADELTSAGAGTTLALTDRTLVRLALSGAGAIDLAGGNEDGLYRILVAETITGTSRIDPSPTVQLASGAWQPSVPGEGITFLWNSAIGKWVELYRSDPGGGGGTGTVTSVSVVSANGLAGTVANPTTTPAITLSTTVNGLLQGNGTAISAATIGTGLSFAGGTLSNTQIGLTDGNKGDITVSGSGATWDINPNAITNTELSDMLGGTIKGRAAGLPGDPQDLTGTQATALLDVFTTSLKGLAPASGGGTTNFLRADGTWAAPTGTGGTVTNVSVVTANGLAGTVADPTTTPAITLSTTVTGILKGNGTAISAATAGIDYQPAGNYVTTDTVQTITATKTMSVNSALAGLTVTQAGAGRSIDVTAGQIGIPDGTAAAPAIAFRDDLNSGIFSPANDVLGIAVNGSEAVRVLQSGGSPVVLVGTSIAYGAITVDSADATGTSGVVMLGHANAGTALQESYRGGQFAGVRSRGTKAAPTGVQAGDGLTSIIGAGWTSAGGINYGSLITMKADETFTSTASGGRIEFHTTLGGTDGFTTLGGTGTARMIIGTNDVTIQPPDDIFLTPGDGLFGAATTVSLTATGTYTGTGNSSAKIVTSAQSVETTTTEINIEAASAGADINIKAADAITNTVGFKSLFTVVDITAGAISTFDYEQIVNTVPLRGPDGSAAAPSYSFSGANGTGMWRSGKSLNFAIDGYNILSLNQNAAGDQIQSVPDGTAARPAYTWFNATDTGFFYDTTDSYIGVSLGGTSRLLIDATSMTSAIAGGPSIRFAAGTVSTPTYGIFGDPDTGMYQPANNQLAFATGGDIGLLLDASAVTSSYTPSIITDNTGMAVGHNSSSRTLTLNTASTPRVTIDGGGDYVEIGSALAYEPGATVNLTADNQAVTVGARSYMKVSSNSGTATARTFTISNGLRTGHVLIIHCIAGAAEILDAGNVQIAGTMTFNASRTLSLIWDGTDWIETARAL